MSAPFRPLADRVVIRADREERAPVETAGGLLVAKTLAAAVDGLDAEDNWFVGTVVAIGPLVNRFDVRAYVLRWLHAKREETGCPTDCLCECVTSAELDELSTAVEALPADCSDPVCVGDRVTFSWAAGQQITMDGDRYLIMRHHEVLAVLEPEE